VEPCPKQFEGIRWRSYIEKVSDTKIAMGLEWAKGEGEFELFGETRAAKESQHDRETVGNDSR
jgi:hypothetical protein